MSGAISLLHQQGALLALFPPLHPLPLWAESLRGFAEQYTEGLPEWGGKLHAECG